MYPKFDVVDDVYDDIVEETHFKLREALGVVEGEK